MKTKYSFAVNKELLMEKLYNSVMKTLQKYYTKPLLLMENCRSTGKVLKFRK